MKNKVLIGVLTVLLVIGMVSCSMDEYAKLGEAMGKMGNNVYGIEPNMQKVNETTKQFDDKVTRNEAGDVEVELVKPADLISSVAEIKNSTKKTEELKKQLDEPLAKDGVSGEEIQQSLKKKVDEIISEATKNVDEEALKNADEKLQSAYQSVKQALDDIKESITDNPTKADLATVSIINDLATTVSDIASNPDDYMKDGELDTEKIIEDANKALQALDALKVTSTAADLDILKDFNLASLFSSSGSGSKALSDDFSSSKDEDAMRKFMFSAIDSFTKMVSVDGKFDEVKYNRFIFQMRAIRTAYETTAWLVTPSLAKGEDQFAVVDAIIDGKNIIGLDSFTANDLVLYAASVVFTECNKLPVKDGSELSFKDAVKAYMEKDASVLEDEDLAKRFEGFEKFFNDVDLSKKDYDVEHLKHSAVTAVNTAAVILVDSGFDLKIIEKAGFKPEDGKSYGEELEKAFENLKNELGKNN